MIPDFKFMWKQLNGPNASWLSDAIYQYFKQQFKPAIDHLNQLCIDNMTLDELMTVGIRNNIPYPIVEVDALSDKYFTIYRDDSYDGPHVINSWYNVIQNFPEYDTLANLDNDIAHIADTNLRGGTVVKCIENNMFYQIIVSMSGDVVTATRNQIGKTDTDTLVTVSTPDYSSSRICRYFGQYAQGSLPAFIETMEDILVDGDIVTVGNEYRVFDDGSFKKFNQVQSFEDYDDTVYPGGMLISDRQVGLAYAWSGIGDTAYRILLKGILNSDAEVGSLGALDDIMKLIIYNDSGSDDASFRYTFKILDEPDAETNSTYGDVYLNMGQQFQWKNIVLWRKVIEDFISNMYNYAPKITVSEEQIVANTYNGFDLYDGSIDYFYG